MNYCNLQSLVHNLKDKYLWKLQAFYVLVYENKNNKTFSAFVSYLIFNVETHLKNIFQS